jgi:hypothetical protein
LTGEAFEEEPMKIPAELYSKNVTETLTNWGWDTLPVGTHPLVVDVKARKVIQGFPFNDTRSIEVTLDISLGRDPEDQNFILTVFTINWVLLPGEGERVPVRILTTEDFLQTSGYDIGSSNKSTSNPLVFSRPKDVLSLISEYDQLAGVRGCMQILHHY